MAEDQENPNVRLMTIQSVENHIIGAINCLCQLSDLSELNEEQTTLRGNCVTALLKFQSGPLLELRRAIE